ncbi:hypothetical protein P0082_02470 [Candidatus Haliotispira prima]|uniref:Uncharacterized protein n=1 Tax=Candidatus Haliotispira prima TaxID=3034016 RepID=A0ABY8MKM3_9SPIO|nr:hypothetical protein P0082_02470 [Candidatus Haliotispira prima]
MVLLKLVSQYLLHVMAARNGIYLKAIANGLKMAFCERELKRHVLTCLFNLLTIPPLAKISKRIYNQLFDSLSPPFHFNLSKPGGSYPGGDNYYYVIGVDDTKKISGKALQLAITNSPPAVKLIVPLTRYSSP